MIRVFASPGTPRNRQCPPPGRRSDLTDDPFAADDRFGELALEPRRASATRSSGTAFRALLDVRLRSDTDASVLL